MPDKEKRQKERLKDARFRLPPEMRTPEVSKETEGGLHWFWKYKIYIHIITNLPIYTGIWLLKFIY